MTMIMDDDIKLDREAHSESGMLFPSQFFAKKIHKNMCVCV
jgi:hypothetical protein